MGFYNIAQDGLANAAILLPQLPVCRDHEHAPSCPNIINSNSLLQQCLNYIERQEDWV